MRDISIHYLKKIPIFFSVIKVLYIWFDKLYIYLTRYRDRSFRTIHYRKLIDGYLKGGTNIDYKKISIKIEREIHKRTKFELNLTPKWWLLFFGLIDSKKQSIDINKCLDDLFNETLCLPFSQNPSAVLLELYALILEYGMYSIGYIIRCRVPKLVLSEGVDKKSISFVLQYSAKLM